MLTKLGLLPHPTRGRSVALAPNLQGQFIDRWVTLERPQSSVCKWTIGLEQFDLPIRHGEGRVVFSLGQEASLYQELVANGQVALRYSEDVNGSYDRIAFICDPTGLILGLMPHPEAHLFDLHRPNQTATPFCRGCWVENVSKYCCPSSNIFGGFTMSSTSIRRALISVSDKSHLATLVPMLQQHQIEVVSSGGTAKALEALGVTVTPIQEVTGNPEAFGGRMKTLSFQVSSALLFRRGHEGDEAQAEELGIEPIDLVICNLYPFATVAARGADWSTLIENIDIGGPTMIRAAAKNCASVCWLIRQTMRPWLLKLVQMELFPQTLEQRLR